MHRVLLVEDDPPIRHAVTRALSEAGHQVQAVDTALGAPLSLTRKEYDVLHFLARRAGRVVQREELFVGV